MFNFLWLLQIHVVKESHSQPTLFVKQVKLELTDRPMVSVLKSSVDVKKECKSSEEVCEF